MTTLRETLTKLADDWERQAPLNPVCRGLMASMTTELRAALDAAPEDKRPEGWRDDPPDCLWLAQNAPDPQSAALWVIAERLGTIVDRLPAPPRR